MNQLKFSMNNENLNSTIYQIDCGNIPLPHTVEFKNFPGNFAIDILNSIFLFLWKKSLQIKIKN
jgi:hypothetical protein